MKTSDPHCNGKGEGASCIGLFAALTSKCAVRVGRDALTWPIARCASQAVLGVHDQAAFRSRRTTRSYMRTVPSQATK